MDSTDDTPRRDGASSVNGRELSAIRDSSSSSPNCVASTPKPRTTYVGRVVNSLTEIGAVPGTVGTEPSIRAAADAIEAGSRRRTPLPAAIPAARLTTGLL